VEQQDFVKLFMPLRGELRAYVISQGVPPGDDEDVLQNTAMVILAKLEEFREGSNFNAWAYAVARNEILAYFKRRRRQKRQFRLDPSTLQRIDRMFAERGAEPRFSQGRLSVCLSRLRGRARTIIDKRYGQGIAVKRIAALMRMKADTVYKILMRSHQRLRECLEREASRLAGRVT
jgi:RNA polymerase sigma-70 factor (ECF subfamily)